MHDHVSGCVEQFLFATVIPAKGWQEILEYSKQEALEI